MVHPSNPGNPPTLLDGLRQYFAFEIACGGQLAIVTRLDRETSGLVLVSKHRLAARELGKAMERRQFRKIYHAVAWGWPEEDAFTIDAPLRRKGEFSASPVYVRQAVHPEGRPSRTDVVVERRVRLDTTNGNRFSLLRCMPVTGRMHQIRAHLHHAGFPIVGDKIYGPADQWYLDFIETGWTPGMEAALLIDRQALHASGFGWEERSWHDPIPPDLESFLGAAASKQ